MVEIEMCFDDLFKPLGFVETFEERKNERVRDEILLMEFLREKEKLLTMVVKQRLVIVSLLLRVKKLKLLLRVMQMVSK